MKGLLLHGSQYGKSTSTVLSELKILKFYGCYVLQGVFVAQFQGLEDFGFILSLCLQGLNICFDGRDWGGSRIDAGLRCGVVDLEVLMVRMF